MSFTTGPRQSIDAPREGPSAPQRASLPGANGPAFRDAAPAQAAPPVEPDAGAAPADEIDVLREAAAAAAADKRARAAERAARIRERDKDLRAREAKIDEVEKRLRVWKNRPDLALQDLQEYGLRFEDLAQVVANGGPTPDQIAAAEAAQARREVEELRRGLAAREMRDAQERAATSKQAEAEATREWHAELRDLVEASAEKYPVVARTLGRGSLDLALDWAEDFLSVKGRAPTNDEVLAGVERHLQDELAELQGVAPAGRPAPRTAATINGQRTTDDGQRITERESEAEKRARVRATLDRLLGNVR